MASFPGSKVHRVSRRSLGRGQTVVKTQLVATPTVSTITVTIAFDRPVIVSGAIELHLSAGGPLVSHEQTSATSVTQVYTTSAAGADWSIDSDAPVRTFQGGTVAPAAGTFS